MAASNAVRSSVGLRGPSRAPPDSGHRAWLEFPTVTSKVFLSPVCAKRGANVGDRMCQIISYFGMKS
jgi:hypothetical protein